MNKQDKNNLIQTSKIVLNEARSRMEAANRNILLVPLSQLGRAKQVAIEMKKYYDNAKLMLEDAYRIKAEPDAEQDAIEELKKQVRYKPMDLDDFMDAIRNKKE